jgi:hypothetical protein
MGELGPAGPMEGVLACYLHFKGVAEDILEMAEVARQIRLGQGDLWDTYSRYSLLEFLLDEKRASAAAVLLDSEQVIYRKKVAAVLAAHNRQPPPAFTLEEQGVLRRGQLFSRLMGEVKVPRHSRCKRCAVMSCAVVRACRLLAPHLACCRWVKGYFCQRLRVEGCTPGRALTLLWCWPCLLLGQCSYHPFYCDQPDLLCCLCNLEGECRVCSTEEHCCPCCLCLGCCLGPQCERC